MGELPCEDLGRRISAGRSRSCNAKHDRPSFSLRELQNTSGGGFDVTFAANLSKKLNRFLIAVDGGFLVMAS